MQIDVFEELPSQTKTSSIQPGTSANDFLFNFKVRTWIWKHHQTKINCVPDADEQLLLATQYTTTSSLYFMHSDTNTQGVKWLQCI